MMTAIRINNVGKAFPSRQAAREYANTNGGKVVDMAKRFDNFIECQIICAEHGIPNSTPRWIVVFDRIICTPHVSNLVSDATQHIHQLGKTVVVSKRKMLSLVAFANRVSKHENLPCRSW